MFRFPLLRYSITPFFLQMKRYIELDLLRSLAVIGMVIYHAAYDLQMFEGWDIDVNSGLWKLSERIIASTFLILVGISFAISWDRTAPALRWKKYLKRGLIVLGCGMLVSLATYIVDPSTYVRFGVLHLIGTAILLLPCFGWKETPRRGVSTKMYMTMIIILACFLIPTFPIADLGSSLSALLIPIGFPPIGFQTVDYFPLLPWFGVILIGLMIGQIFYVDYLTWRHHLPHPLIPISSLTWPGRHALLIYLLHQPILFLLGKFIF